MKISLLVICLFLVISFSNAQVGDISVTITSLKNSKGSVLIYLYQNEVGFPTEPARAFKKASTTIKDAVCVHTFSGLPYGNYAISIVHDENGNNQLDTNFMGIPKEGIAASNNAKGNFGPPKFNDAVFNHQRKQTTISITTTY